MTPSGRIGTVGTDTPCTLRRQGARLPQGSLSFFLACVLMRTNVYVDGLNLYYRALRDTPYRWLDLGELARLLLPRHDLGRIRYFTAIVTSRPDDPTQAQRQQAYLRALQTLPNLTIHYGHFLAKTKRRPLARQPRMGSRTVEILDMEEKGSDVNLACYLLLDGFKDEYEMAVVISNDSDLQLPIKMARTSVGKQLGVFDPSRRRSFELHGAASWYRPLRRGPLSALPSEPRRHDVPPGRPPYSRIPNARNVSKNDAHSTWKWSQTFGIFAFFEVAGTASSSVTTLPPSVIACAITQGSAPPRKSAAWFGSYLDVT